MELKSFKRGRKAIVFSRTLNPGSENAAAPEEEERKICHEQPLPSLDASFAALRHIILTFNRHTPDILGDIAVWKMAVFYTKAGTRSIQLWYNLATDTITGTPHVLTTPQFRIDPADEESGELFLDDADAELCKAAIRECEAYTEGKRGQGLLNFDADKEALNAQFGAKEDEQQSFELPESPETAKRRKSKEAAGV